VTLTVRQPKSAEFRAAVLDAVHAALVSSAFPRPIFSSACWSSWENWSFGGGRLIHT